MATLTEPQARYRRAAEIWGELARFAILSAIASRDEATARWLIAMAAADATYAATCARLAQGVMARRTGILKRPTVLVADGTRRWLMDLSKAAIADLAWSLACRLTECGDDAVQVDHTLREEWAVIDVHRKGWA